MTDPKKSQDLKTLRQLYEQVLRIRIVEESIAEIYHLREMRTPTHFCTGQEAIPAGVCAALNKSDLLYAYYRSHGWYLGKGGNLQRMIDEFFGKETGCSRGLGGSMHLIDLEAGLQGTSAIVAGAMPHAVGAAFTQVYNDTGNVVVSAFGDAATEEGLFQESLMFAALRKLPVIFICENNRIATNTSIEERQPPVPIFKRAEGFGVASYIVDGNDALEVFATAKQAVSRARAGEGPTFIECTTYRVLEHCGQNFDYALGHRNEKDAEPWLARDPVKKLEVYFEEAERLELTHKFKNEITQAFTNARSAPFPTALIPEGLQWQS